MKKAAAAEPAGRQAAVAPRSSSRRWLVFVHQLPSSPSNIRVRTWRRLQQLGAVVVKQAVYVLPDSPGAREDFEWLKTEIETAGGQATVFAANNVDAWSDDALVEEFRRARQDAYAELVRDLERNVISRRAGRSRRPPTARRLIEGFRQRLAAIERVDFFGSAGRDRVVAMLDQLEQRLRGAGAPASASASRARTTSSAPQAYQQCLWVTRPRPGVDRMASAWLVRRFIDREARFGFAADRDAVPRNGIPFDMFGVDLSHRGEDCTFETLVKTFEIRDAAVRRMASVVHDLDLKDGRFGAPEAPAIGAVIEGLQLGYADDDALLAHGMTLFDALYRSFEQSGRRPRPRQVARHDGKRRRPKA